MAKFCGKCGNELKEGSKFCVVCGAPVPGAAAASSGAQYEAPQRSAVSGTKAPAAGNKKKPAALIGILVVAVIAIVAVFSLAGGKGYEKPIKYMEKGINEGDIATLAKAFSGDISAMIPESSIDILGAGQELKLTVVDEEKLDKDQIVEVLTEEFYLSAQQAASAKKAYILTVNAAIIGGDEDSDEGDEEIVVIKKDGEWVIPIPLGF